MEKLICFIEFRRPKSNKCHGFFLKLHITLIQKAQTCVDPKHRPEQTLIIDDSRGRDRWRGFGEARGCQFCEPQQGASSTQDVAMLYLSDPDRRDQGQEQSQKGIVYYPVQSYCSGQCCGTVTIFYGSGSDFWKLWFRFRFQLLKSYGSGSYFEKLRFRFRVRFQLNI
jgi:hypothetical protein